MGLVTQSYISSLTRKPPGVIAHRSLSRQAFSLLQARTFPIYFLLCTTLSAILLALWSTANIEVFKHDEGSFNFKSIFKLGDQVVVQCWVLLLVVVVSFVNWFYIGPNTNRRAIKYLILSVLTFFRLAMQRQRQERAEAKPYYDPGVSQAMRQLNREFGYWHGISSLTNLIGILATIYHGLWFNVLGLRQRPIMAEIF
ncbi:hypothetical protein FRC14_003688 [Serendipita sp. 396]|nr:hypothetical protein FRC14_003688 [Serendipita sp. 396]KAG8867275.1 hypothetical protein FRC20_006209 [Serendipita sp. 405]